MLFKSQLLTNVVAFVIVLVLLGYWFNSQPATRQLELRNQASNIFLEISKCLAVCQF